MRRRVHISRLTPSLSSLPRGPPGPGVPAAVGGGPRPAGAGAAETQHRQGGGDREQHLQGEGVLQLPPRAGATSATFAHTQRGTQTFALRVPRSGMSVLPLYYCRGVRVFQEDISKLRRKIEKAKKPAENVRNGDEILNEEINEYKVCVNNVCVCVDTCVCACVPACVYVHTCKLSILGKNALASLAYNPFPNVCILPHSHTHTPPLCTRLV